MTDWPPRVLSNLYRNGLQRFDELLLDLITKSLRLSEESSGSRGDCLLREQARERLMRDGDPPEYCTLLKSSYAVMAETAPSLGHVSFEQRWTQEQIVDRVIVLQFQQEDKPSHVLCGGYRKLRPSIVQSGQRRSPPGLECVCENASVEIVTSPSWKILLSRVGDLTMLHVLTHAAVFSPLANNCFLQVSGGPTSGVVSMPGRSLSVHPGEKMLGAGVRRKWMSESCTRPHKLTGRNLHSCVAENEEKQPAGNIGVVRNQTSNFTISPYLKRHRTESAETGLNMDVLDGYSKYPSRGNIGSKRQRRASGDKVCQNGEIVRCDKVDTSKDAAIQFSNYSPPDLPATSSESNLRSFCSRRTAEGTTVQYSVQNKGLLDDGGNPQSYNSRKRRKLTEKIEKDRYFQEENKLNRLSDQVSADFKAMVPPPLEHGKVTKKNTESYMQLEGGISRLGHETSASPSNVDGTSSSKKRVRLPSWKRRKLRQAQELCPESVHKDPPVESCGKGQSGIATQVNISQLKKPAAKVEDVIIKTVKEESQLHASGSHPHQALDKADSGCRLSSAEGTGGTNFGRRAPKNTPQKKKPPYGMGTADGVPERLIDRAPIFYSSSFSCHPGLPAKHILNTSQPDETGVARLFSAIFGGHCKIFVCSVTVGHNSRRGSRFKSLHKLLQELFSNARRCQFSRLLRRHCPLPEGFHSTHKDARPVSALLRESQTLKTERAGGELGKEMHEDKKEELSCPDPAPEVQEIMSLLLGQNYRPMERTTVAHSETNSTTPSEIVLERSEFCSIAQQTNISSVEMTEQEKQDNAHEPSLDDNLAIEKSKQAELISNYTSHSKVVGFLWAVCRSIVPQQMLGCLRSWRSLRGSIAHFVGLRRHEKFNVKHALFKLRLSSFSWLGFQSNEDNTTPEILSGRVTVEEGAVQQRRLELWLYWLFTSLVVPLIRAHFYVTENENHRQNIFYYRKPVWARIRSSGMRELTSKNYKKLSKHAVAQILNSRVLGFSKIRFLPKKTGLRPIANLAASSQGTLKYSVPSRGKATLRQVFGNISQEHSLGDCSKNDGRVWSLPHELVSPIMSNMSQCAALVPYEASASIDAEKSAVGEKEPLGDWCLNKSSTATNGSSSSPGAGKKRGSLVLAKSPNILKRSKKSVSFSFRSINSVLRDAYYCLKLEKEAHPEDLGSSVFGYCDIHRKILPFIMQLKESPNGMPRLFMAVCDLTKAYDNIPQEKLQEIAESFVQSSNFKVARYTCITPTLASVRVSHGRTCTLTDEPMKFVDSVRGLATKRSHCIFVDQAFSTSVRRDNVLAILGAHVKENIVQIGSQFYQQKVGIPQGSILSSLLCSLFYGHFDVHSLLPAVQSHHSNEASNDLFGTISAGRKRNEGTGEGGPCLTSSVARVAGFHECDDIQKLLEFSFEVSDKGQDYCVETKPNVCNEANPESDLSELQDNSLPSGCEQGCDETVTFKRDSVLLRLIDDSLFISTSEGGAKRFVESMHRGSKDYGCQANERKTTTSFCLQLGNEVLPRKVYKSEDGACFMRWSGLLVNCFTLEFQADYTRYCGEHIRSALTVRREKNQGWHLVVKMCQYMRPKCHALFFDPRINSPATIRLNAFQAFLLCAMKFHAYVCCLPHVTETNEPFLYKAIDCATRYMYVLLRHKMHSVGAEAEAYFPYKELEWLALVAFDRVLKRKQSRYPILLNMLRTKLRMSKYAKLIACPHLSSATDERRSSMFKYIKY